MAFSFIDWLVLGAYLAGIMLVGLRFSGRQKTSDEFFLGSRRFSALTISLSLLVTGLSAITYVGIPGLACEHDWSLFLSGAIGVVSMLFVARYFMPFFYNLGVPSVYEYLLRRFDVRVSLLGGVIFLAVRGLFAGIAIYAPSVALCAVTGWNLYLCIVLFGFLTMLYTAFGGMSAVIWTDVVQCVVLLVGALVCLGVLFFSINLSPSEMVSSLVEQDKVRVFDFRWSWVEMTFWGSVFGGFAYNLAAYGTDQVMLQRCMASSSLKASQKSLILNAWYTIPVILIFFVLGSLLFLFRQGHAGAIPEGLPGDQIFPYFIAHHLPMGVSGLLIAAIFAAAMSTLSSILNSLATITVTDFGKKLLLPGRTDAQYTAWAKGMTVMWGLVAIGCALFTEHLSDSVSLAALKAGGLFTGPILGTFLLGIFCPKITPSGAFYGTLVGLLTSLTAGFLTPLDSFWLLCVSCLVTAVVATVISFCAPQGAEQVQARRKYTWFSDEKAT
jgi:solute:Na+ symporter, SSS family